MARGTLNCSISRNRGEKVRNQIMGRRIPPRPLSVDSSPGERAQWCFDHGLEVGWIVMRQSELAELACDLSSRGDIVKRLLDVAQHRPACSGLRGSASDCGCCDVGEAINAVRRAWGQG